MKPIKIPKNCTGCAACSAVCTHNAISLCADKEGFRYPQIDSSLCTECGACASVCPVLNESSHSKAAKIYAVRATDSSVRMNSSSGGFFSVLASKVIADGGIVYGAAFSSDYKSVKHTGIEKSEDIYKLRGSKYIQCVNDRSLFSEITKELISNRTVLFSGTPCQVEGIKSFLKQDYNNLITVDMVCHGVPSPSVWRAYISELEKENGSTVQNVSFRDKVSGWKKYSFTVDFANGKHFTQIVTENPYMRAFVRSVTIRKSCYNCPFRRLERVSDLTMADFWGCEKVTPQMNDNTGITLAFVNNEKGETLFRTLSDTEFSQVSESDALRENRSMYIQTDYNFNRNYFFDNLDNLSAKELLMTAANRQTLLTRAVGKYHRIKQKIGDSK
ncbi:MAG TPA: (4Fe-4S)-binding protein [Ruminococcaceae bacterium]|nr:(4Fe-4S)-binding protein [Oscillospiraceae bacterium]